MEDRLGEVVDLHSGFYALGKLMRMISVKGIRRHPSVRTMEKGDVGQLWKF